MSQMQTGRARSLVPSASPPRFPDGLRARLRLLIRKYVGRPQQDAFIREIEVVQNTCRLASGRQRTKQRGRPMRDVRRRIERLRRMSRSFHKLLIDGSYVGREVDRWLNIALTQVCAGSGVTTKTGGAAAASPKKPTERVPFHLVEPRTPRQVCSVSEVLNVLARVNAALAIADVEMPRRGRPLDTATKLRELLIGQVLAHYLIPLSAKRIIRELEK